MKSCTRGTKCSALSRHRNANKATFYEGCCLVRFGTRDCLVRRYERTEGQTDGRTDGRTDERQANLITTQAIEKQDNVTYWRIASMTFSTWLHLAHSVIISVLR